MSAGINKWLQACQGASHDLESREKFRQQQFDYRQQSLGGSSPKTTKPNTKTPQPQKHAQQPRNLALFASTEPELKQNNLIYIVSPLQWGRLKKQSKTRRLGQMTDENWKKKIYYKQNWKIQTLCISYLTCLHSAADYNNRAPWKAV